MRMFKQNADIRIKRRAMLRNAHIEFNENMQNLLCTQWLKVYSYQMETKSGNQNSGPFSKTDLASLARHWLEKRRITRRKYPRFTKINVETSTKEIIETYSTSSKISGAVATSGMPRTKILFDTLPETKLSSLAKVKPRNNLKDIMKDISMALCPKNMNSNLGTAKRGASTKEQPTEGTGTTSIHATETRD